MFGKLKEKLKGALSVFSKKTEEEAEDIPQEEVEQLLEEKEVAQEEPVIEESEEEKPAVKKSDEEIKTPTKEKKSISPKKDTKKPAVEKKAETKPVDEEQDISEEDIAKVDELIEEASKDTSPEIAESFSPGTLQYQPDLEKIKEEVEEQKAQAEPESEEEKPVEKEEKKSFFGKLFKKKTQEEKVEEPAQEKPVEKVVEEPKTEIAKEEPKSFLGKVKQSLTTKKISSEKFEELFWELEVVLLENNVSVEVIERIKKDLSEELVDKLLPRNVLAKIQETLRVTLTDILSYEYDDIITQINQKEGPFIIAFFGINGAGKTTSAAKLTHYLQEQGKSVVLAACDTFRAAAIDQLQEHADKLNVKMIRHDYGSDAAAVAFDAVKYATKNNVDVVLIDTAGRLHSNTNLMAELEKLIRVAKPDLKVFVGESITGNDCIEQAQKFNELVQMDGAILTKADVDEKGGAPLSISYVIGKPILFLGVGQEYKDLVPFDKEKVLESLGL